MVVALPTPSSPGSGCPIYEFWNHLADFPLNGLAYLTVGKLRLSDDQTRARRLDYGARYTWEAVDLQDALPPG